METTLIQSFVKLQKLRWEIALQRQPDLNHPLWIRITGRTGDEMSCSTLGNPGMISRPSFSHVVAPLPHSYSHAEHHEKYCVWLVLHPSYAISDTKHSSFPASLFLPMTSVYKLIQQLNECQEFYQVKE